MIFVGEIGIPRREYLYELRFWEMLLIGRGYSRRHHAGWEQARLVAYNAAHAMGSKHQPPPVTQWLPLPWEHTTADLPSDDVVNEIRRQLQEKNAKINNK